MKEKRKELEQRIAALVNEIKLLEKEISDLDRQCDHNWKVKSGPDAQGGYINECTKCGAEYIVS